MADRFWLHAALLQPVEHRQPCHHLDQLQRLLQIILLEGKQGGRQRGFLSEPALIASPNALATFSTATKSITSDGKLR